MKKPVKQLKINNHLIIMKICIKCKITKDKKMFNRHSSYKDGLRSTCKQCISEKRKNINNKPLESGNKKCNKCLITKDVKFFSKDKTKSDGLQYYCKECIQNNKNLKNINNFNITKKKCNTCNKIKQLNDFHKNSSGKYGYHNNCKICRSNKRKNLNYKKINKDKKCTSCKLILSSDKFNRDKSNSSGLQTYCKKCQKNKTIKWRNTFQGFLKGLYKDLKSNAKKRNINVEISIKDIIDQYHKQNGKCYYSNINLTFNKQNSKNEKNRLINPWNISVDRTNSKLHYTKDNIKIVSAYINRAKSDLDEKIFLDMCFSVSKFFKNNL
jgi:hypothetical protein